MQQGIKRPRVVIVGAGFGGLAAAKRLANRPVDVTLVDRRNHHVFQPLLYQVATAALSPADIAGPIRSILRGAPNIKVLLDEVKGVDTNSNSIQLARSGELPFDWLILATGARHSYFGHEDWAAHAPGLKSIEDALDIRRKVLLALERAETEPDLERRKALLTFVVIGAGPTGVEMAGAIAELSRRSVSNDFRSITPHCSRVVLVEAGERVLGGLPANLSQAAHRSLESLGVEIRVESPVRDIGNGYVQFEDELLFAQTIVWAAGVKASPAADWLGADSDLNGRLFVEDDLRVCGFERIFAIGDTAAMHRPLPAVAPVAKQQGRFVADLILGRWGKTFTYRDFGSLATIGRSKAVIDMNGLQLTGFIAWLIWSFAHIFFLIGYRSRVAVTINWLWSYLTYQRSARLITGDVEPLRPAPLLQPITRKCA